MAILVLSVLAMMVGICPVSRAAEGKDESWKVPVYSYQDAINQFGKHANESPKAEYFLRLAIYLGAPDIQQQEFAETSLVYHLCRQFKSREALELARTCWAKYGTLLSLLRLVDATYTHGDVESAKAILREIVKNPGSWGDQKDCIKGLVGQLSTRTYRVVFDISADQLAGQNSVTFAIPTSDMPTQKVTKCDIAGAASYERKTDGFGNVCYIAKPIAGRSIRITTEMTMTPYSYRMQLSSAKDGPLPAEIQKYLLPTPATPNVVNVDPKGPRAQSVASHLRGKSVVETVENVLRWCQLNLKDVDSKSKTAHYTSEEILAQGGGHCENKSEAAIAILRACGIPARAVRGNPILPNGQTTQHTMLEFYVSGVGWVDWDYGVPLWSSTTGFIRRFRYDGPEPHQIDGKWFLDAAQAKGGGKYTWELIDEKL